MKQSRLIIGLVVLLAAGAIVITMAKRPLHVSTVTTTSVRTDTDVDTTSDADEDGSVPPSVAVSPDELNGQPHDTMALGGYNVLIADRGNNRLIEVTPDKQIVWEYHFDLPRLGLGADDAFFTDDGKSIIVNLEEYHLIEIIDYQTKQVVWSYGTAGHPGKEPGFLNTPDDAYKLPNGNIITADIKNCRVIEISPDKQIVHQYGQTGKCGNSNGLLDKPNGDTPLPDGHILISNIVGKDLIELDQNFQPVFTMSLPVKYPSDPQQTKAGNILISDYSTPGKIVEVSRQGQVVWQYDGGTPTLDRPSLAVELPNGNILANDDFNHRVIVIDKQTNQIIWQYGVTRKPGNAYGQLNIPDGVDIIQRTSAFNSAHTTVYTIGYAMRHSDEVLNQDVTLQGYPLKKENGYVIFSDESSGGLTVNDLPVIGDGLSSVSLGTKYILRGTFTKGGVSAVNKNPYHLQLSSPPVPTT